MERVMEGKLTESDVLRIAAKLSKKLDKELEGKQKQSELVNRVLSALVKARWNHMGDCISPVTI